MDFLAPFSFQISDAFKQVTVDVLIPPIENKHVLLTEALCVLTRPSFLLSNAILFTVKAVAEPTTEQTSSFRLHVLLMHRFDWHGRTATRRLPYPHSPAAPCATIHTS
jgi:hypothetical protein